MGQFLLSLNPKLKGKKKRQYNPLTQSSGPQIRNQIQPRLTQTPLGKGWRKADKHKVFLELLCCFKNNGVFLSHFCCFLSIFIGDEYFSEFFFPAFGDMMSFFRKAFFFSQLSSVSPLWDCSMEPKVSLTSLN